MKTINEQYQRIIKAIEAAKIAKAFELTDALIEGFDIDSEERNALIVLKSRHSAFIQKDILNVLEQDSAVVFNELVKDLKNLLDAIIAQIKPNSQSENDLVESIREKRILELQREIQKMNDAHLKDIFVPENYQLELSKNLDFSFCYPKDWRLKVSSSLNRQVVLYAEVLKPAQSPQNFSTNFNVVIEYIAHWNSSVEEIIQMGIQTIMQQFVNFAPTLVLNQPCLFSGLKSNRLIIQYHVPSQGSEEPYVIPVTLYQQSIANHQKDKIYHISFTSSTADFDSQRQQFDDIISTFKI